MRFEISGIMDVCNSQITFFQSDTFQKESKNIVSEDGNYEWLIEI